MPWSKEQSFENKGDFVHQWLFVTNQKGDPMQGSVELARTAVCPKMRTPCQGGTRAAQAALSRSHAQIEMASLSETLMFFINMVLHNF